VGSTGKATVGRVARSPMAAEAKGRQNEYFKINNLIFFSQQILNC
jgi:hypothetical protein